MRSEEQNATVPIAGTYVIRQAPAPSFRSPWDKPTHVLYLLESGRFLFIGYWEGYEVSVAAGYWRQEGNRVDLMGSGQFLAMDVLPHPIGKWKFARTFELR